MYSLNTEANVKACVGRLNQRTYKPRPARRVEISKDNGKTRSPNIYCYEDKLVQKVLKRILEAVFEHHFYEEMMGFRANRGCHQTLKPYNYVQYLLDEIPKHMEDTNCSFLDGLLPWSNNLPAEIRKA